MKTSTRIILFGLALLGTSATALPAFAAQPQSLSSDSYITTSLSHNWSGYVADTAGTYTSVTGTWTIPTVTPSQTASADATWVGIGGVTGNPNDLIQAGTQAVSQDGQIAYQAWYELLPDGSIPVALTVSPGDSITATLTLQSANTWLITIRDNTTNQTYSNTVNYQSSESSADWIEEMPSDGTGFIPLDDFGSVAFSNAAATVNGASENLISAGARALTTVAGTSTVLSAPSAIGSDNESFSVTRTDASSSGMPRIIRSWRGAFSRGGDGVQGYTGSTSGNTSSDQGTTTTETKTYQYGPFTVHITYTTS